MENLLKEVDKFLMVASRITGIFFTAPIFSNINLPYKFRATLVLAISFIIFPYAKITTPAFGVSYLIAVVLQLLIGMLIGYVASLFIQAFNISGELFSLQMGLGIASVFSPIQMVQERVPLMSHFLHILALLLFISLDGHLIMLIALAKSFDKLPVISLDKLIHIKDFFVSSFIYIFTTAVKLALPMIGVLSLFTIALGLLTKAAPLINIMVIGWQLSLFVGFITLIILLPILFNFSIANIFNKLFDQIDVLLGVIIG